METNPHSPLKSHSFVRKSRRQRQRFPRIVTETSNSSRIIDWFGWGLSIVALTDGRTGGFDWVSFWNTQHLLTNWRRGRITIHYHFFCFCFFKMKSVKERIWNDRFFPDPHLNEIFLPALSSSSSSATTTTWRAVLMMFCFRFGYFSLVSFSQNYFLCHRECFVASHSGDSRISLSLSFSRTKNLSSELHRLSSSSLCLLQQHYKLPTIIITIVINTDLLLGSCWCCNRSFVRSVFLSEKYR